MDLVFGYARVSTGDQDPQLQIDALKAAGCTDIYIDRGQSGTKASRPEFDKMVSQLRKGDTVVVWRLDRLGRNLKHLTTLVDEWGTLGINLRSLHEEIDTTSANGRLIFNIMATLAQFERDLTSERTKAGLASARARGKNGGRPKKVTDSKVAMALALRDRGESTTDICRELGISRSSYFKAVADAKA